MGRRLVVLLLALAAFLFGPLLVLAPPAEAHNSFIGSNPPDGATVAGPLTQVRLGFVDPPSGNAAFAVVAPSGARVDGGLRTEPQPYGGYTVTVELKPLSETGRYTVDYFTVALDGVPLSGQFSFTYTGSSQAPAGAGSSAPPAGAGRGTAPRSRLPLAAVPPAPLLLLGAMLVVTVVGRRPLPTPAHGPAGPARCPGCGETVAPDQGFCGRCGAPLR
jgi:methionine-rich copper-binding protein CopC